MGLPQQIIRLANPAAKREEVVVSPPQGTRDGFSGGLLDLHADELRSRALNMPSPASSPPR